MNFFSTQNYQFENWVIAKNKKNTLVQKKTSCFILFDHLLWTVFRIDLENYFSGQFE